MFDVQNLAYATLICTLVMNVIGHRVLVVRRTRFIAGASCWGQCDISRDPRYCRRHHQAIGLGAVKGLLRNRTVVVPVYPQSQKRIHPVQWGEKGRERGWWGLVRGLRTSL